MADVVADMSKKCKDCKGESKLLLDHTTGDLICTRCGLVLEDHCFDAGEEWRSFKPEGVGSGGDGDSKARADAMDAFNVMLGEEAHTTTSLSGTGDMARGLQRAMAMVETQARSKTAAASAAATAPAAARSAAKSAAKAAAAAAAGAKRPLQGGGAGAEGAAKVPRQSDQDEKEQKEQKDRKAINAFTEKARQVANRLTLGEEVVNRCVAFLQDLAETGGLKQRPSIGWICAVVHLASREEGATKTVRELALANVDTSRIRQAAPAAAKAAAPGAMLQVGKSQPAEKDAKAAAVERLERVIENSLKELTKDLGLAKVSAHVEDEDTMKRLVRQTGLAPQVAGHASRIVQQAYRQASILRLAGIARTSQDALMAAAIFVVAWLMDVEAKPSFQRVAAVAKVTEASVLAAYRMVHPALAYLVPGVPVRLPGGLAGLPPPR